jgi:hypothetical protein
MPLNVSSFLRWLLAQRRSHHRIPGSLVSLDDNWDSHELRSKSEGKRNPADSGMLSRRLLTSGRLSLANNMSGIRSK